MDFEIVPGNRQNDLVIYENGVLSKIKYIQRLCGYLWKCVKRRCKAKIYIDENVGELLELDDQHTNHEKPSANELKTKLFSNQLKRKVGKCTGRTSKFVNREILNDPQIQKIITTVNVYNIKQCIYRQRKKHILSLPKNRVEVTSVPTENLEVKCVEDHRFAMSSESSNQSVSSPPPSVAGNVTPEMERYVFGEVQQVNNLEEQAGPAEPEEEDRPSVIVWNLKKLRYAQETARLAAIRPV